MRNQIAPARVGVDMRRHLLALCTVALGAVTLAACAQPVGSVSAGASAPAASPGASSSSAPAPAPSPSATMAPPIILASPPGQVGGSTATMSLSGQIFAGAEPSCLLLTNGKTQYLLLAADSMKLRVGIRVAVTGHVEHGIMTHCQQGQPFEVTSVDVLTP